VNPLKADWKAYLSTRPEEQQTNPTQADKLVKLALENVTLFHAPDGEGFADLDLNGVRQTHALRTRAFRDWLSSTFYDQEGKTPGGQALQDALGTLEGQARFRGEERPVFVRFAILEFEGSTRLYLDLGKPDWAAIEIDSTGWRLVNAPPVRFKRPKSLRSLPMPVTGGSVRELLAVLNLSDDTYPLLAGWLASCLMPKGAYPLLDLTGEQGTAKTTTARFIKDLIDPSEGGIRAAPRNEDDLIIAARGSHVLAFDNLSSVSPALSDALCRLSTGGGLGKRTLYSDAEETILEAMRPVILTGIEELATRPDLLDRAVLLELPLIPETDRKPLEEIEAKFSSVAPRVLGALLTAASEALRNKPNVKLKALPRMADFAVWVTACESALDLKEGEFLLAYREARDRGNTMAVESHPVPEKIRELLTSTSSWTGTIKLLLETLLGLFPTKGKNQIPDAPKNFPKTPKALGDDLRRYAPVLRTIGIEYTKNRTSEGITVTLTRSPNPHEPKMKTLNLEQTGLQSTLSTQVHDSRPGQKNLSELRVNIDDQVHSRNTKPLEVHPMFMASASDTDRATRQSVLHVHDELQKPIHPKSTFELTPELKSKFRAMSLKQADRMALPNLLEAAENGETSAFERLYELEAQQPQRVRVKP
jgi:hypothetical protein